MGAQLNINDIKPYLSDKSIENIANAAMSELDIYNKDSKRYHAETVNGFHIEVTVFYKGYNYRRVELYFCEITKYDSVNETYYSDDDCEAYSESLNNCIADLIYSLNSKDEEYYYENQEEFTF